MRKDIRQTKLSKLKNFKKAEIDPYPEKCKRDMSIQKALNDFEDLAKKKITLIGRVRSMRPMGGSTFANIEDEKGKIQIFLNKKNISSDQYKLFVKNIESGDFVQVSGILFKTKKEEKTLNITDWKVLSKNIRPIPTEYFGLKDTEMLLRKRYLDLMLNPETRDLFRKKNIFWQTIRNFLSKKRFLEVQTPVLEHTPGGADAEPFTTHHNALDQDFYLRISLELPLKRLLVGGYEKVFEIGRVFRNEGIDREHLQEFDHMEFYLAYSDMEKGMELVEAMYKKIVENIVNVDKIEDMQGNKRVKGVEELKDIKKSLVTEYEEEKIDWAPKWSRIDYFTVFEKETGIDLNQDISVSDLKKKAKELNIDFENSYGKGRMIDTIYKKTVRQKLVQPCFLVGHPIEVSPLAKQDPQNSKKVLRFQPVAGRSELGNGFSELNDPREQKSRFEEQMKLRDAGDTEAQMIDEDFVEALEYGMPPAVGFGMSERLFAFLMNKSIRETVIFPAMKQEND